LFDLQPIENKRVEIGFIAQDVSSDGGLLLIKEIEERMGIVKAARILPEDLGKKGKTDVYSRSEWSQIWFRCCRKK
jgi:hypothetical protein